MAEETPGGLKSTTGSQGELADRKSTPGFPSGQATSVQGSANGGK
jgi:hypothetical protein